MRIGFFASTLVSCSVCLGCGTDSETERAGGGETSAGAASSQGGDPHDTGSGGSDGGVGEGGGASPGGGDGACNPPDSVDLDGRCVPSCGAAHGNTCVDGSSTLCEGLATIESYDCEVCCVRPVYPAPSPASFHFVFESSPSHWDSILSLSDSNPSVAFVSQNKPDQVPYERWSAYLSYRSDPPPTAADINALLVDPEHAPRYVMLEELHDAESEAYFAELAAEMNASYPQWRGRWGVFVGFGDYPAWSDAVDALLDAGAMFSLELYPSQSEYCSAGQNGGQRDIWLAETFTGNAQTGRLDWLLARRANRSSDSFVTPLFGVGDVLLDGTSPAVFLDRMFYVWMTRTGHPSLISADQGGPGAYKWQDVAETPLGYGVGNTSRDLAFTESFAHYSKAGLTTSRLGPVTCP